MNLKLFIHILCIVLLPIPHIAQSAFIIFDLGGVLITHDNAAIGLDLGIVDLLLYVQEDKKNPFKLSQRLLTVLDSFGQQLEVDDEGIATLQGNVIPQIVCDLFCGKISNEEILKKTINRINTFEREKKLVSSREKKLLKKLAVAIFEPTFSVNYFKPVPAIVAVLKKLAAKKDGKGNPEHTLVVLSNWDKGSFPQLLNHPNTKEIFGYFDKNNIIISGFLGTMKPHRTIFIKVLQQLKAQPKQCVFIDDQEENITAAQACGMHTILVTNKNGPALEQDLKKLGAL